MLKECRERVDAIRKRHLENKLGKTINKTAAKSAAEDDSKAPSGQKKKGA